MTAVLERTESLLLALETIYLKNYGVYIYLKKTLIKLTQQGMFYICITIYRLLRLRGVIARALPNALPEKSMRAIYHTPKICKFPHL